MQVELGPKGGGSRALAPLGSSPLGPHGELKSRPPTPSREWRGAGRRAPLRSLIPDSDYGRKATKKTLKYLYNNLCLGLNLRALKEASSMECSVYMVTGLEVQ